MAERLRELFKDETIEAFAESKDLARGLGKVALPIALDRKYPNAPAEWG